MSDGHRLTARELAVVTLAAQGCTNPEIAGQLLISRRTVHRHLANAMAKCGTVNRTELAGLALLCGWVDGSALLERIAQRRRMMRGEE